MGVGGAAGVRLGESGRGGGAAALASHRIRALSGTLGFAGSNPPVFESARLRPVGRPSAGGAARRPPRCCQGARRQLARLTRSG